MIVVIERFQILTADTAILFLLYFSRLAMAAGGNKAVREASGERAFYLRGAGPLSLGGPKPLSCAQVAPKLAVPKTGGRPVPFGEIRAKYRWEIRVSESLKARMRAGTAVYGFWIELFSPTAAEVMAAAGYDCAMIDLEHGAADLGAAVAVMRAMNGSGCTPLVRVPANDAAWIKRVLDAGAAGVMIPAVNDAAEAEAAVAACHYPPRGIRGMAAPIVRAAGYGVDWRGYVDAIGRSVLTICQIETRAAVDNVAEIVAVPGLDMVFIGPFDLSASLGYMGEPDHPDVRAAIGAVEAAAKAAGCLLGAIPTPERSVKALYDAGYDLVLADGDLVFLREGALAGVAALREITGRQ